MFSAKDVVKIIILCKSSSLKCLNLTDNEEEEDEDPDYLQALMDLKPDGL
jgi:hypothetical protein